MVIILVTHIQNAYLIIQPIIVEESTTTTAPTATDSEFREQTFTKFPGELSTCDLRY